MASNSGAQSQRTRKAKEIRAEKQRVQRFLTLTSSSIHACLRVFQRSLHWLGPVSFVKLDCSRGLDSLVWKRSYSLGTEVMAFVVFPGLLLCHFCRKPLFLTDIVLKWLSTCLESGTFWSRGGDTHNLFSQMCPLTC